MKRLLFAFAAFCITMVANSQAGNTNTTRKTNTSTGQTKPVNGDLYLHTIKGKHRVYATYVNSKVTGYYALDLNGRRLPARIITKQGTTAARQLKCYTCIKVVDPATGKSAEDCTEVPCPDNLTTGEKATIKTAQ